MLRGWWLVYRWSSLTWGAANLPSSTNEKRTSISPAVPEAMMVAAPMGFLAATGLGPAENSVQKSFNQILTLEVCAHACAFICVYYIIHICMCIYTYTYIYIDRCTYSMCFIHSSIYLGDPKSSKLKLLWVHHSQQPHPPIAQGVASPRSPNDKDQSGNRCR